MTRKTTALNRQACCFAWDKLAIARRQVVGRRLGRVERTVPHPGGGEMRCRWEGSWWSKRPPSPLQDHGWHWHATLVVRAWWQHGRLNQRWSACLEGDVFGGEMVGRCRTSEHAHVEVELSADTRRVAIAQLSNLLEKVERQAVALA